MLVVPRVLRPPEFEEFLEMKPGDGVAGGLAKVDGFFQREPRDAEPSTQRTVAYLGYDDKNLYLIFVCFDSEPEAVRARLVRREDTAGDDSVGVALDTFNDQRRAYFFISNPLGIQFDGLANEGQPIDGSFDTLWHSRGQLTREGYVVWMAIPFKSLRFSPDPEQTWRIQLARFIPRANEATYWPHYSSRLEGRMNQAATLRGLLNISPGRNLQLIPYGLFRSFRAPDFRDPAQPRLVRDPAQPDAGLDAKFVFQDNLVLDVALNPDFSQVESDEPQVTVNQRFEVFFPEKRPFFLENTNYFATPIDLLFTRRIFDPQFGVRLTGKVGHYALGGFLIDDEAPGKSIPPSLPASDPLQRLREKRALFGILRVSRDLFEQSSLGLIYTDREFESTYNRLGGLDGRLKLSQNWVASFQGVVSATRCLPASFFDSVGFRVRQLIDGCFPKDSGDFAGPAYSAELRRSGRQLNYRFEYDDRGRGFRTAPGFLRRPDIRRQANTLTYRFRPEGKYLISWGPEFFYHRVWDHSGTRLDWTSDNALYWEFTGQTQFGIAYHNFRERLRPQDFPQPPPPSPPLFSQPLDFSQKHFGLLVRTSYIRQVTLESVARWGQRVNFFPPAGQARPPFLADWNDLSFRLTLRPVTQLRIDNTYLLTRLRDRATGAAILNDHILRSKWNWQFTRELSLRVILQYTANLTNPSFTVLPTTKNLNADFLLTYLVNPWTALFIGYNSNLQNFEPGLSPILPPNDFINDAKQFFVKFSYLLRF